MKPKIYWWLLQLDSIGGTEMVSTFLANHLLDDYDITIISSSHVEHNAYDIDPRIKMVSLEIPHDVMTVDQSIGYYWKNKEFKKLFKLYFNLVKYMVFKRHSIRKQIEELITKDNATLICSAIDSYWFAPKKGRVLFHFHFNDYLYSSFSNRLVMSLSRKPDKTIFICQETMNKVLTKHKNLEGKVDYALNPCRFNNILNLDYHDNNICFLGRFVKQKNPLFALKVAKELNNRQFNFHLNMVGHGSLIKDMQKYIDDNHLNNVVTISPVTYDVQGLMKNYDLVILPSIFEGFGLTIVEANSMSVPVISSNWGDGVKEVIDEGQNGFIIDDFDEKIYADKIIEVLSNKEQLKSLKASSCQHNEKFNIDQIIPRWKNILFKE